MSDSNDVPAFPRRRRRPGRPPANEGGPSRRRRIRDAAVSVFASKGYHDARIADIAHEADVAHGLIYHYFPGGKEAVLTDVTTWTLRNLTAGVDQIAANDDPAPRQLAAVVELVMGWYRIVPNLVRVVVLEVTRSQTLRAHATEILPAFVAIEGIVERGQQAGTIRSDIPAKHISHMFWGSLEEVATGWMFGTLPTDDEGIDAAERSVIAFVTAALAPA